MSTNTPNEESPRIPWLYLGGLVILFIGFGISFFGGFLFNGGRENVPPPDKFPSLALIGLGVAVFALGGFLLARIDQVRGPDLSLIVVTFIMMPLPSLLSYLINFLGNYVRRTNSTAAQVVLAGVGVFLLTLAGNWAWELHQTGVTIIDFRALAWTVFADFGVVCLLLAFLPMFLAQEAVAVQAPVEPERGAR